MADAGPATTPDAMTTPDPGTSLGDIRLEAVSLDYDTPSGPLSVLREVSMNVPAGGFTAVVGPSGCGKSTLTKLVTGLMRPNAGRIMVDGAEIKGPKPIVGMAFQNPVLLEWRTIEENVTLPLEIVPNSLSKAQRRERAAELLALVGLTGFEQNRPSELSGGMRQRASLCRALVHKPEILILDEPFGALDAFTREDLWVTMRALRRQENFTCVLITHDLREAVYLADEVLVFSQRPAIVQHRMTVDLPDERSLETLYDPHAVALLAELRRQIQIAQGRLDPTAEGNAP